MTAPRGSLKHDGGYRVLVYGGRDYRDRNAVRHALEKVHRHRGILCVITGMAGIIHSETGEVVCGADLFAWEWAKGYGIPTAEFPVTRGEWKTLGKAAGPLRNQRMIDLGLPDVAIEMPGGAGTADMRRRLDWKGIVVYEPCAAAVASPLSARTYR